MLSCSISFYSHSHFALFGLRWLRHFICIASPFFLPSTRPFSYGFLAGLRCCFCLLRPSIPSCFACFFGFARFASLHVYLCLLSLRFCLCSLVFYVSHDSLTPVPDGSTLPTLATIHCLFPGSAIYAYTIGFKALLFLPHVRAPLGYDSTRRYATTENAGTFASDQHMHYVAAIWLLY